MWQYLLIYYTSFLFLGLVCYLAGYLILLKLLRVKQNNTYLNIALCLLLGKILFLTTTAFIVSRFQTLYLVLIIIAVFLYYSRSKNVVQQNNTIQYNKFLSVFLVASLIFFFRFYFLAQSNFLGYPDRDFFVYAYNSNYLLDVGKENASLDYINTEGLGATPYHYFELWTTVGIKAIFQLNPLYSLLLIVYSLGTTLVYISLRAFIDILAQKLDKSLKNYQKDFFALLSLFVSGFFLKLYTQVDFMANAGIFAQSVFAINQKFYYIYIFILLSLVFFLKNAKRTAILLLLCLPIIHISTAFAIIPTVFLYTSWQVFRKNSKQNWINVCIPILVSLSIVLFYYFASGNVESHVSTDVGGLGKKYSTLFEIKTSINIILGTIIQVTLLFLPIILLAVVLIYQNFKNIFIFSNDYILIYCLIPIIALIAWSALHILSGSIQIFTNISSILLNIFSILIFFIAILSAKKYFSLPSLLIWIFMVANNFLQSYEYNFTQQKQQQDYLTSIKKYSKKLSKIGVYLLAKEDYIGFSFLHNSVPVGKYVMFFNHDTYPTSISPHVMPFSNDKLLATYQKEGQVSTPFYQYVEKQKRNKQFVSIEQSQVDFIKAFQVNYLITTKNVVLSEKLQQLVDKKIVDKKSREHFYLLSIK